MKKGLLFTLALAFTGSIFAQSVVFIDKDGNDLPETVTVLFDKKGLTEIPEEYRSLTVDGYIYNKSASPVAISIKREIVDNTYVKDSVWYDVWGNGEYDWVKPQDQFCWGMCYFYSAKDQEATLSDQNNPIPAGQKRSLHDVVHYTHYGIKGTTKLKYSIINGSNIDDWFVVEFKVDSTVSVAENKLASISNLYPNPTTGEATVEYKFEKVVNGKIVVRNVIGKMIEVYDVDGMLGAKRINLAAYPSGVYFVNIENNGRVVANKKLIKQ